MGVGLLAVVHGVLLLRFFLGVDRVPQRLEVFLVWVTAVLFRRGLAAPYIRFAFVLGQPVRALPIRLRRVLVVRGL